MDLSNEINNRLTALLGQVQLLLREDLSEKSRGRVEMIEVEATRMVEVIRKLESYTVEIELKSRGGSNIKVPR